MENSAAGSGELPTVQTMTVMRIDGDGVAALGDRLVEIAGLLQEQARTPSGTDDLAGFIAPSAAGAMASLLGDFELARVELDGRLHSLAELARAAGACYLDTEQMASQAMRPTLLDGQRVGPR